MFVSRVIDARARAAARRILENQPRLTAMLVFVTLLVSNLCCCESLSSIEMFDVFDESDMDFQAIGNITDNLYGDAFHDSDVTSFGRYVNITNNSSSEARNRTERYNVTDQNLNDSTAKRNFTADKLTNKMTDENEQTNNKLVNNHSAGIKYGNADIRRPLNNATNYLINDTAYHNGNASNRTQINSDGELLNDNDAVTFYDTGYYNDDTQIDDSASIKKPFKNVRVFSNSGNGEIKAQIKNTTDFLTNNEAYKNDNADINGQPINTVGYLYNNVAYNNINANIKEEINNATEFMNNKNILKLGNDNENIETQLRKRTELLSNYARNQNGGEYSWTPFTPFNNAITNGTANTIYMDTTKFNKGTLPAFNIPASPFACPEEEPPSNIGPYEVPTERDMISHMKNHLLAMYQGFHTRAMHFLRDVKEATQASWSRKMYCRGPTELMYYRRCVRWVADISVLTTKSLVTALETIRLDVSTLIQGKICSISALSVDPVHLLRILAAEKVSLEFALPDFLRQLHACARHCPSVRRSLQEEYLKYAHLTDQDFVTRHYFTQQNYNRQLKQQYKF